MSSENLSWLLCSAPQSLPEAVASAHSSGAESESTSDSDSSSDSESESSSSDSEENEPHEPPAPEVLCPLQETMLRWQHSGARVHCGPDRGTEWFCALGPCFPAPTVCGTNSFYLLIPYQTFGSGGLGERSSLSCLK